MTLGIFPGKFLPLHRGHLAGILQAHTLVDRLVVVLSWSPEDDAICLRDGLRRPISEVQRKQWLRQELQGFENIDVRSVDESTVPPFPGGWEEWALRVQEAVGEPIDLIFGGEPEYAVSFRHFFPGAQYVMVDPHRGQW
ncbi:MAG TPA: adenylyltransferase/cytidyltransferase family protein, partial [Synergistaceae bacterium]|nr:adenylyltransferase/cytidyltransferase family protein [Synergistaceae bacterium]